MKDSPLVSVICLCHNHAPYVVEAMKSVLQQTYENIELIVVDDGSTDASVEVIRKFLASEKGIEFIAIRQNIGNCQAFNKGWAKAQGKYVIDLAADDVLFPNRVNVGVEAFEQEGDAVGVHFSDALIIDKHGNKIGEHNTGQLFGGDVPQGYIFTNLLSRYFINPVTMMLSNAMLKELGGYDDSLAYEDFDLWVRSAKQFKYIYSPETLVAKRDLAGSHGKQQYRIGSKMTVSTFRVCQKAFVLCETSEEYTALVCRLNYEGKRALLSLHLGLAWRFYKLKRLTLLQAKG